MGVLAPLVTQAQPRLIDFNVSATAGASWWFGLTGLVDTAGDPIDLSDESITWECKIMSGDTDVVTVTVVGGSDGSLTMTVDEDATVGLDVGATNSSARRCSWYLIGDDGDDVVQFWGPAGSLFEINKGVA